MQNAIILAITVVGFLALSFYSGIFSGRLKKGMFLYYTNLSNLLVCIYFFMLFLYRISDINALSFLEDSVVSFSVTMIITMTFLVFHFILVPYAMKNEDIILQLDVKIGECVIFHYIIPIAVILYWFFYADKKLDNPFMCFLWLGAPLVYFIFIMFRAGKGKVIDGTKSRFPYPFIDIDLIGKRRCVENIFGLFAVFILLSGFLYYYV